MQHNPYQAPAPAAAPPGMAGAFAAGSYEFTGIENNTIDAAGARTRWWGMVSLIGGIIGLLFTTVIVVGLASMGLYAKLGARAGVLTAAVFGFLGPLSLVYAVVGKLYIDSGNALRLVVTTQGNDIDHLLTALDKMAGAFRLEVIMSVLALILGFVAGVLIVAGTVAF